MADEAPRLVVPGGSGVCLLVANGIGDGVKDFEGLGIGWWLEVDTEKDFPALVDQFEADEGSGEA